MVRLGALADESTPVLTDLGANATDINNLIRRLGPFSQAAIPAIDSLGEASKTGTPAVIDARPVIADLRAPGEVRAAGRRDAARGARVLPRHRRHRARDGLHLLPSGRGQRLRRGRALPARRPAGERVHDLRRRAGRRAARRSSRSTPPRRPRAGRARRARSTPRATTPCCARPRSRWRRRSARRSRRRASSRPRPTSPSRSDKAATKPTPAQAARRGGKAKPEEEIPEAIPTIDPSVPRRRRPRRPPRPRRRRRRPPPPRPRRRPRRPTPAPADPADALLGLPLRR